MVKTLLEIAADYIQDDLSPYMNVLHELPYEVLQRILPACSPYQLLSLEQHVPQALTEVAWKHLGMKHYPLDQRTDINYHFAHKTSYAHYRHLFFKNYLSKKLLPCLAYRTSLCNADFLQESKVLYTQSNHIYPPRTDLPDQNVADTTDDGLVKHIVKHVLYTTELSFTPRLLQCLDLYPTLVRAFVCHLHKLTIHLCSLAGQRALNFFQMLGQMILANNLKELLLYDVEWHPFYWELLFMFCSGCLQCSQCQDNLWLQGYSTDVKTPCCTCGYSTDVKNPCCTCGYSTDISQHVPIPTNSHQCLRSAELRNSLVEKHPVWEAGESFEQFLNANFIASGHTLLAHSYATILQQVSSLCLPGLNYSEKTMLCHDDDDHTTVSDCDDTLLGADSYHSSLDHSSQDYLGKDLDGEMDLYDEALICRYQEKSWAESFYQQTTKAACPHVQGLNSFTLKPECTEPFITYWATALARYLPTWSSLQELILVVRMDRDLDFVRPAIFEKMQQGQLKKLSFRISLPAPEEGGNFLWDGLQLFLKDLPERFSGPMTHFGYQNGQMTTRNSHQQLIFPNERIWGTQSLFLESIHLEDEAAVQQLSQYMICDQALCRIKLHFCCFTHNGLQLFITALCNRGKQMLEQLDICQVTLGKNETAWRSLVQLIQSNHKRLDDLSLTHCGIRTDQICSLEFLTALKDCHRLTHLDLSFNDLTADSLVRFVAQVLHQKSSLRCLQIGGTSLGASHLKVLMDSLLTLPGRSFPLLDHLMLYISSQQFKSADSIHLLQQLHQIVKVFDCNSIDTSDYVAQM